MTTRQRSYSVGGLPKPKRDEEQRKGQWNTRFPCFWPLSSVGAAARRGAGAEALCQGTLTASRSAD